MSRSVRVKRRHVYSSIQDDDRYRPEQLQDSQLESGRRALSETGATLSPSAASGSLPPPLPHHDPGYPSQNVSVPRRDMSRVNRLTRRSSVSYRSFAADLDSNPANSPQTAYGQLQDSTLRETLLEGTSTDLAVPHPHRTHPQRVSRVRSALSSSQSGSHRDSDSDSESDSEDEDGIMEDDEHHHDDHVVDHLDVIDPQVATVATLTNTANAILLPPLSFYNRKPVVTLPRGREPDAEGESVRTASTDELDRHVHDVLKRKNKFRRVMKGVWAFLKTPLGIAFGIYGFLVVFWGTALVFFLFHWIKVGNNQGLWTEICEQILNGLFCLTGIGLIPWRVVDTYRVIYIWYYKRLTRKLRKKAGLPELYDKEDLPDPIFDPNHVRVLTDKQQYQLHHHQKKFMKSQTWYRPHGTETHRAFPINTALWICIFNDANSVFQCTLAGCMWGMNRFQRPAWSTSVLILLAFTCGIISGILIWRGGKKTKRTERVEERLRRVLEMDELAHAVAPESVLAKLPDSIRPRFMGNKERGPAGTGSSEKVGESNPGAPNGRTNRGDYASTITSSVRTPGIRIEEEMIVPPSN